MNTKWVESWHKTTKLKCGSIKIIPDRYKLLKKQRFKSVDWDMESAEKVKRRDDCSVPSERAFAYIGHQK